MLWKLITFILVLAILAFVALAAYAYIGPWVFPADFTAPQSQITKPVTLSAQ